MSDSPKDPRKVDSSLKPGTKEPHTQRYQWPPVRDPDLTYKAGTRNPVHAIITALPLMMVVAGLYIYYRGESQQAHNTPIFAESVESTGIFTGLSATSDRHYLWLEIDGIAKGVRIQEDQVPLLESLVRDLPIQVRMAPSVHESTTHWAWYVEQSGNVYLDMQDSLR